MGLLQCAGYLALIGVGAHILGEALPRDWFDPSHFPYKCAKWEEALYKALGVRSWKDKLPDMSRIMPDMVPKSVKRAEPSALLAETCVAECIHWLLSLAGLFCLKIWPGPGGRSVFLLWFLAGNLPFIMIQRYNRPRLERYLVRRAQHGAKGIDETHENACFELQHRRRA